MSASDPGVVGAHAVAGGGTVTVETHTAVAVRGAPGAHAAGGGRPEFTHCDTRAPGGLAYLDYLVSSHLLDATRPQPGTTEVLHHTCTRADGSTASWYSTPAPAGPIAAPVLPTALDLARRAAATLIPPLPDVHTSPQGPQLVGFPTWFWIQGWSPLTKPAAVPTLSSTVTARPTDVTYRVDDGTTLRCAGPGTPWRRGGGPRQHSDCTHTFTHHGRHQVDATVTWTYTWVSTNGQTGTLPDVDRTRTVALDAQEGQAIID